MKKILLLIIVVLFKTNTSIANIIITNGLTHQYKVEKGHLYQGKISLHNTGNNVKNVKLYIQDVSYNAKGETFYTPPNNKQWSNTNWIKLSNNLVTLQGGAQTDILFEITIPDSILDPGSYFSILMIEPEEPIIIDPNKKGIQINSVIRYAVQIITDYSYAIAKANISFEDIQIQEHDDKRLLNIILENKGSVYCRTTIYLEIYKNEDVNRIEGVFESENMSLLPNTSKTYLVDISMLEKGKYRIIAFAKDTDNNIFALEFELDV